MQKNTKLIAITAMIAVIGAFTLIMTTVEESEISTSKEFITQTVQGAMHEYPLEVLSEGTQYAIVGKVTDIEAQREPFDAEMDTVFSYVTIKVKEDLFGAYDQKYITVKVRGGETETMLTETDFSPEFQINEKVLIFVPEKEPDSIYGDNYYVAGHFQGKYKLDNGNAERQDGKNHTEKDLKIKIKDFRN